MTRPKVKYRCKDLPWQDVRPCLDFSPSYEVDTQEEYLDKLKDAERHLNDPAYFESKYRRKAHLMMPGGRTQMRFPDHHLPRDRSKGGPEASGKKRTPESRSRLLRDDPPWNARTQSMNTRAIANSSSSMETRLADVISEWVALHPQDNGFRVPRSKELLVQAGFPAKAAWLLVSRAPGRTFKNKEGRLPQTLSARLASSLGGPLTPVEDFADGRPVYRAVVGVNTARFGRRGANVDSLILHHLPSRESEKISLNILVKRALSTKVPGALGQLTDEIVSSTLEDLDWKPSDVEIHVISRGGVLSTLSPGEHSVSSETLPRAFKPDYRNLQNVSLAQLPGVLVRLMIHKSKKTGRRLPRIA